MDYNAFIAAIRGAQTSRMESLTKTDPQSWLNWRRHCELTIATNNWGNRRARVEIMRAMMDAAATITQHVAHGVPADPHAAVAAPGALLDTLAGCFISPAHAGEARLEARNCRQRENESLQEYFTRCQVLFARANPGIAAADIPNNQDLMDTFAAGVLYGPAREALGRERTSFANLGAMKARAAGIIHYDSTQMAGQGGSEMALTARQPGNLNAINAVNTDPPDSAIQAVRQTGGAIRCRVCNRPGHVWRDCDQVRRFVQNRSNGSRGRRGSGRSRGRGGRGGPGRRPPRSDGADPSRVSRGLRAIHQLGQGLDEGQQPMEQGAAEAQEEFGFYEEPSGN